MVTLRKKSNKPKTKPRKKKENQTYYLNKLWDQPNRKLKLKLRTKNETSNQMKNTENRSIIIDQTRHPQIWLGLIRARS